MINKCFPVWKMLVYKAENKKNFIKEIYNYNIIQCKKEFLSSKYLAESKKA